MLERDNIEICKKELNKSIAGFVLWLQIFNLDEVSSLGVSPYPTAELGARKKVVRYEDILDYWHYLLTTVHL